MCKDVMKPSLIASAFFLGWALTLIWVPRLGDVYGRKKLFLFGTVSGAFLYTALMFTESLNLTIALSFCFGCLTSIRINIGSVYLLEMMPKSWKTAMGTFWSIIEGSVYVLATLYFWQVSKSWVGFVGIGYVLQLISAFTIWGIPESPVYLLANQ